MEDEKDQGWLRSRINGDFFIEKNNSTLHSYDFIENNSIIQREDR